MSVEEGALLLLRVAGCELKKKLCFCCLLEELMAQVEDNELHLYCELWLRIFDLSRQGVQNRVPDINLFLYLIGHHLPPSVVRSLCCGARCSLGPIGLAPHALRHPLHSADAY